MSKTKMFNKTVTTILVLLLTLSILNVALNTLIVKADPGIIWVEADYTAPYVHAGSQTDPYGNITYALSVAAANDIIEVKPGVYNYTVETFPLTIARTNLTIISTGGAASTIINASGSTASVCVFNITAANDTIGASGQGFTIQSGASPATGSVTGSPVYAHAIDVYGNCSTIVSNTIIIGQGNTAGVHIAYGNNGTGHLIKGNTFRSVAAGEGWGIMAENLTNSVIQDNLFYGDSAFVDNSVAGGPGTGIIINDANNVNITGNTAYYLKYTLLTFNANHPRLTSTGYAYDDCRNASIANILVTNNTAHDCGGGVTLEYGYRSGQPGGWTPTANLTIGSNVNIGPSNKFYNDGDAIRITENRTHSDSGTIGCVFGATAANLKINNNDLYNSAVKSWWGQTKGFGVWCGQTGPVNATFNWWGDPIGPYNATNSGLGDLVSGNVTYNPWLNVPYELNEVAALNIYPTSGPPGINVGASSQSGTFTAGETVNFYFDGSLTGNSTTAKTNGAMNGTFTVPQKTAGAHEAGARGSTSNTYVSATFTISSPTITLIPNRGSVGTTVAIVGLNFNVTGAVNVTFAGTQWGSIFPANATGGFSGTRTVPSKPAGTYTVNASDGISYATATFTIPTASISLNVTNGPPGTPVLLTGEGFGIADLVKILFGTTQVTTTLGDSTGNVSISFNVPGKAPGTSYIVNATDWVTGVNTTTSFTIPTLSISLNVTTGPPGTPVRVYGPNFNCSGAVNVYFNASLVKTDTANATGYLNTTLTVPGISTGTYAVNASDGINYATTNFAIPAPSVSLNVTAGPSGTTVGIYGPNFNCSRSVNVYFNASLVKTDTANATGYLNTTFTVPSIAIGTYAVNASDGINYATTNFTVGAAIYLSPTSGVPRGTVMVTGAGLSANQTVQIYFDNILQTTVNATATGALPANTNFTVPDAIAGAHNVKAFDVYTSTYTPNATFTVNSPSITLNPTQGQVGQTVMVTGSSFKLNATVNIYFGSTLVGTVNATATGDLPANTNFTVPSVLPSLCTVNASDGVNYATATFNVIGTGGIDTLQSMVAEIEAKLDQYGSFWNFTNTWFTSISNKLGVFTGADTVASLLYNIKTSVSTINWTDITAIKAKTDTINWADIASLKSTTTLSVDYLWGLQDHPLWGLRTVVVPILQSIKNATQFTAGTYNTNIPNSTTPVNLGKSSTVTLTVRATDDTTAGFVIKAYIYDGTAWRPLSFNVSGIASSDCAATVQFTTGTDGRFYFETTGATFTAFIYTAESAP